jgi:flagellin
MAAILSTNMASLYAQKNLSTAQASLSTSVQRLSSGTRINSAKDDAAGYGIAESIKGTKAITDQSILNTKNAISQVQTAEGALDVVGKILQRVLTLTTQRQDGTLNSDQTASINNEIASLLNEVQNIKERTQFNGSTGSVFGATNTLSTGAGVASTIEIANLSLGGGTGAYWTGSLGDFAEAIIEAGFEDDPSLDDYGVGGAAFELGTFSSPVPIGSNLYYGDGNTMINSGVTVTNYYLDNMGMGFQVIEFEGLTNEALLSLETWAESNNVMSLNDITISIGDSGLGLGLVDASGADAADNGKIAYSAYFDGNSGVQSLEADDVADLSAEVVQDAIQNNSTNRADLGAWLNRLEYAVDNMQTLSTNLADGISRIVDTDYAAETSNLTRTQIMQQAATSMLAQANQMPNVILTLLK